MNSLDKLGTKKVGSANTTNRPANTVQKTFPVQSYVSEALGINAIVAQTNQGGIIAETLTDGGASGTGLALTPDSQTPLAVRFSGGGVVDGQRGGSATYILTPGQVIRPVGGGVFGGFKFGLPYGWLGGGNANIVVLRDQDADTSWPAVERDVMFHQFTTLSQMTIPAGPYTNTSKNWPLGFPWALAQRANKTGTKLIQAGADPELSVRPTKIILRFRDTTIPANTVFQFVFIGSDYLDANSDGILSDPTITVPSGSISEEFVYPGPTIASGAYTGLQINSESLIATMGASYGVMFLLNNYKANLPVDIMRYGRL